MLGHYATYCVGAQPRLSCSNGDFWGESHRGARVDECAVGVGREMAKVGGF